MAELTSDKTGMGEMFALPMKLPRAAVRRARGQRERFQTATSESRWAITQPTHPYYAGARVVIATVGLQGLYRNASHGLDVTLWKWSATARDVEGNIVSICQDGSMAISSYVALNSGLFRRAAVFAKRANWLTKVGKPFRTLCETKPQRLCSIHRRRNKTVASALGESKHCIFDAKKSWFVTP